MRGRKAEPRRTHHPDSPEKGAPQILPRSRGRGTAEGGGGGTGKGADRSRFEGEVARPGGGKRRRRRKKGKPSRSPRWLPPLEPFTRYLAAGVVAAPKQRAGAEALAASERLRHAFFRAVMDGLGAAATCRQKACQRARSCRSAKAACFYERRGEIAKDVLPAIVAAARARISGYAPGASEEAES